jgi:hypothetical protein
MVVDLAAFDRWRPLVQQPGQGPDQPCLTLAALAQEDDVVPGDDGALQVGKHRLAESDDAREGILSGPQPLEQVVPEFLLDGAKLVSASPQLAERAGCWR